MTLPPQLPPTPGTAVTRQSPAVSGAAFLMPDSSQDGAMVTAKVPFALPGSQPDDYAAMLALMPAS